MRNINFVYLIILIILTQNTFAQISFLGFEQNQCVTNRDYSSETVYCGSHSYSYKIYKGGNLIYDAGCESGFYKSKGVNGLLFINDSVGFMLESYTDQNNLTGYIRINKTTNSGKSWSFFSEPPKIFGPIESCAFYVINDNNGVYVSTTYDNGPLPKHILINNIVDSIYKDTTYIYQVNGSSLCGIDTLSFKLKNGNDTIAYKIVLNFTSSRIQIKSKNERILIYPNPVSDFLKIEHIEGTIDNEIRIYDNLGRMIKTFSNLQNGEFYIGDLVRGLYYLNFVYKDSRMSIKFIKK